MVSLRDDFTAGVKRELMLRAGTRCSNPHCRKSTVGPSESARTGVAVVGAAAHITAAAPGGPRYDRTLSEAEGRAYFNGIWACADHARLIDTDEFRYSTELLMAWKLRAEQLARWALEARQLKRALFAHEIEVTKINFREAIFNFTADIGLADFLGRTKARLTSRVLAEVVLNALSHGNSLSACIRSTPHSISVLSRCPRFNWHQLRNAEFPGGGALSLEDLERAANNELSFSHQYLGKTNVWSVVDTLDRYGRRDKSPCTATIEDLRASEVEDIERHFEGCNEIHILVDNELVMLSDFRELVLLLHGERLRRSRILFHGLDSDDPLCARLYRLFPNSKFI